MLRSRAVRSLRAAFSPGLTVGGSGTRPSSAGAAPENKEKTHPLVLKEDYPGLGVAGDRVFVRGGFARNFLHPAKLAVPARGGPEATAALVARIRRRRRNREQQGEAEAAAAEAGAADRQADGGVVPQGAPEGVAAGGPTAEEREALQLQEVLARLTAQPLVVLREVAPIAEGAERKAGQPPPLTELVTAEDVAAAVTKQQQIALDPGWLDMPDPINHLGEFEVGLKMRQAASGAPVTLDLRVEPPRGASKADKRSAKGKKRGQKKGGR